MPYMSDVVRVDGAKLRAIRKARPGRHTQAEVAADARISRSYLSEIELGTKLPGRRIAERLADVLRVQLKEFVIDP